ncbi:MAG: sigma-54-dependent Fis family transcriptional regulator [Candidatus Tectomicrobia bacterium]|uniref:Sigma-54-dependent Fis family transcriptional regulator n=1 Tax=Tectimicrobiota bacterium TaxID=2528274 RepID=A0A932M2T6_UNCTE|nr:sigma-54-dependent Fis family transcriptional regulator [Candidatus Tectomicrobia bacterium]
MRHRILLVEDEPILRVTLSNDLSEEGYEVTPASDGAEGLARIRERSFDAALLDLKLPKADGLSLLQSFKAANPQGLAIMMTAYGTIQSAIAAMKAGATDYLLKPFPTDELLVLLRGLLAQHAVLSGERTKLPGLRQFGDLIYASEKMARVCDLIATVARSDATVLIQGETGTGKELVARAIHQQSGRRAQPLIPVACAAIPETLLETELFGHEKGAFTGAIRERKGRFELAHRGSLFLDEVADLGPAVQAKLLRVLQEKEFERVGGTQTIKADVRLISATRKRLEDEVVAGRLREDLFYRLKVITVLLPLLRERKEDILPLAAHFLEKYSRPLGKDVRGFSSEACRQLLAYHWPGNIRELEATVQRAVTLTKNTILTAEDLSFEVGLTPTDKTNVPAHPLTDTVREAERRYLQEVLQSVGGQRKRAAEILGISRKTLWKKMKLLGME